MFRTRLRVMMTRTSFTMIIASFDKSRVEGNEVEAVRIDGWGQYAARNLVRRETA